MTTPKKKDRSNAYYIDHLRRHFPKIYDDYMAGKYKSVSEARRAAGRLKPPSPLQVLKREWAKASIKQREDFKLWAGLTLGATHPGVLTSSSLTDASGYLLPSVINRIRTICEKRGIGAGLVMGEMVGKPRSPALGFALTRDSRPKEYLLKNLVVWLDKNSHI